MKMPIFLLLVATGLGVWFTIQQTGSVGEKEMPSSNLRQRARVSDSAFWKSAVVPEPENFREPVAAGFSREIPKVDYPARIQNLQAEGDTEALNLAVADWFKSDPGAAREWLTGFENLDPFQFAIAEISGHLARIGEVSLALEWAELLPIGEKKHQSLFDIYSFAARSRQMTPEKLQAAPLPPEEIEKLLSGIADD